VGVAELRDRVAEPGACEPDRGLHFASARIIRQSSLRREPDWRFFFADSPLIFLEHV